MRVLDLCAAPGGKATHLAALVGEAGEVVAVERNPRRADELRRTCERLRAERVRVETGDAAEPRADAPFDAVLVDPPCSGLGTLQGRPDLRWRARPEAIARAGAASAADPRRRRRRSSRPGGALVYATCTISPQENEQVVQRFLAVTTDFALDAGAQLLPHRDAHRRLLPRPPCAARPSANTHHALPCARRRGHERAEGGPGSRVPRLSRAVAAPDDDAGPLPLRLLPAPLRAVVRLPQLRRALDDRAHVEHGDPHLQPLQSLDAHAGLTADRVAVRRPAAPSATLRHR